MKDYSFYLEPGTFSKEFASEVRADETLDYVLYACSDEISEYSEYSEYAEYIGCFL